MQRWFLPLLLLALMGASCSKAPLERGHKKVLVLGDSLTEGNGLDPSLAFPARLEALIASKGFPEVTVVADGVSGSTSDSGPGRLGARYDRGESYDLLVLELGANDGLQGKDLGDLRENLIRTLRLARDHGTRVVLAGMKVPPLNGLHYMKDFQDLFPDLARREKVVLIPFLLEGVAGHPKLNLDGIHPNAAGQEVVARTVYRALEPLL